MNAHPWRSDEVHWLDLVIDVLARPAAAFRGLRYRQWLLGALAIFLLAQLPATLADPLLTATLEDPALTGTWSLSGLLLRLVASIPILIVVTGVTHGVALLLGGQATFAAILQALALTTMPQLLVAPFVVAAYILPAAVALLGIALLAALLWSLVITVVAIRETYTFSTLRALAALILPAVVLAFVFVLILVGLTALFLGTP